MLDPVSKLWELLKRMRATVAAAEGMRDFQLQAQVKASAALEPKLRALGDNLREALVVSAVPPASVAITDGVALLTVSVPLTNVNCSSVPQGFLTPPRSYSCPPGWCRPGPC